MRDPQSVGLDFGACAVSPRCVNSIEIHRDIAGYLNRELLNRVGLKGNVLGRVRSNPVCDVILSHGRGADKWPPEKVFVPQGAILLQVGQLKCQPLGRRKICENKKSKEKAESFHGIRASDFGQNGSWGISMSSRLLTR